MLRAIPEHFRHFQKAPISFLRHERDKDRVTHRRENVNVDIHWERLISSKRD